MQKKKLSPILAFGLCLTGLAPMQSSMAQSMTNTATTITLNEPCISVPSGAYTLTLSYDDEDYGYTGELVYSVTVSDSNSVMVITIPDANLPTIAVQGWDLTTTEGMIKLTSSTQDATLVFFEDQFNCTPLGIHRTEGRAQSMKKDNEEERALLWALLQLGIG